MNTPDRVHGPTGWEPDRYAVYEAPRARPFHDLVGQVRADVPALVLDLGCGDGALTRTLAERWPASRVIGVDSSPEMLERARRDDPQGLVEWVEADLATWDPAAVGQPADVVVSNAALQWVPDHLRVLDRWVTRLAPGGWLAVQVPGNFDAPSHALMRETAREHPRSGELIAALDRPSAAEPDTYLHLLARAGCRVDAWETTYLHVLDPDGAMESPVLEWVRATGLRPVLQTLTDPEERTTFLDAYDARLRTAYPRTDVGVVLPFRRVFAVAQKEHG